MIYWSIDDLQVRFFFSGVPWGIEPLLWTLTMDSLSGFLSGLSQLFIIDVMMTCFSNQLPQSRRFAKHCLYYRDFKRKEVSNENHHFQIDLCFDSAALNRGKQRPPMASLSYYAGGEWTNFPYESEPRKPQIKVEMVKKLVDFLLPGNSAGDLFGMVKTWPFQRLMVTSNDLGSKGHELNHFVFFIFRRFLPFSIIFWCVFIVWETGGGAVDKSFQRELLTGFPMDEAPNETSRTWVHVEDSAEQPLNYQPWMVASIYWPNESEKLGYVLFESTLHPGCQWQMKVCRNPYWTGTGWGVDPNYSDNIICI